MMTGEYLSRYCYSGSKERELYILLNIQCRLVRVALVVVAVCISYFYVDLSSLCGIAAMEIVIILQCRAC